MTTRADWFTRAFGNAVADARTVLIDEGWFNRRPPPDYFPSHSQDSREAPDTERDPLGRTGEPQGESERRVEQARDHGIEIDR